MYQTSEISLSIRDGILINETFSSFQFSHGGRTVSLFGEVEFIANYRELAMFRPAESDIIQVLKRFCSEGNQSTAIHLLTELVGLFVIVIEEENVVTHLYRSGDIDIPVYYGICSGQFVLDTSWLKIVQQLEPLEISQSGLSHFLDHGTATDFETIFKGVSILKPYALYSFTPKNCALTLDAHAYPGFHTIDVTNPPVYSINDYQVAISCYKEHFPSFALAYSGGPDSNLLELLYDDKVSELVTLAYQMPYSTSNREREVRASTQAASKLGKAITVAEIDFSDVEKLSPYFQHYVLANPFTSFLAVHYYALAEKVNASIILHGQNADNVWDWGYHQVYFSTKSPHSTSATHIKDRVKGDLKTLFVGSASVKTRIRRLITRYLSRYAMIHSFERWRFRGVIELSRAIGREYDCMARFPYKAFVLQRYINYCTTGESTVWASSARYSGKRAFSPYVSPLALHVNSHIPRQNFFDIKAPFRRFTSEFDPSTLPAVNDERLGTLTEDRSPLFNRLEDKDFNFPFLDAVSRRYVQASPKPIRKYQLFCILDYVHQARS